MLKLEMTIDGKAVGDARIFDVINPATGEVFGQAPECSKENLDRAFEAAAKAFVHWRQDETVRRDALRAASYAIAAAADDIAPMLTAEQGKSLTDAITEVNSASAYIGMFAEMETKPEVIHDDDKSFVSVVRRPMGPVAAITPWNYPLEMPIGKISPALLMGNTVVLKPSPYTPLTSLMLGELLRSVLPPGVLNVVSGGNQLGAWMTQHPVPRKLTFTGSVATGKKVAAAAATDLKRVTLELGGNDPAIVLDDVDPSAIANDLFWNSFENNGQACIDIKRLYVPDCIYDDVVDAVAWQARSVRVGNGMDEGIQLGPINNGPQFNRVSHLVYDALRHGGLAVTGGKPRGGRGFFFEPTILANIEDGQRIVDEEQFGPALPIIRYRKIEEAIQRANATHFGLGGSVWGTDIERAWEIAQQLECGTVWVNTHLASVSGQPFGGFKWSGIGREGGRWALDAYSEVQAMYCRKDNRPEIPPA
jgi:acyl-CoA reductase-like NAD-dependent aldehyde dehydrogenase